MTCTEFTIKDLRRILYEASGDSDGEDVEVATIDSEFDHLGYDSLALLETSSRIEREFRIKLDDSSPFYLATPRALIAAVNAQLVVARIM